MTWYDFLQVLEVVRTGAHSAVGNFVEMLVDEHVRPIEAQPNERSSHVLGIGGL